MASTGNTSKRKERRKAEFIQSEAKRLIKGVIAAGLNPSAILLTKNGLRVELEGVVSGDGVAVDDKLDDDKSEDISWAKLVDGYH
jgi:hypothetical protein